MYECGGEVSILCLIQCSTDSIFKSDERKSALQTPCFFFAPQDSASICEHNCFFQFSSEKNVIHVPLFRMQCPYEFGGFSAHKNNYFSVSKKKLFFFFCALFWRETLFLTFKMVLSQFYFVLPKKNHLLKFSKCVYVYSARAANDDLGSVVHICELWIRLYRIQNNSKQCQVLTRWLLINWTNAYVVESNWTKTSLFSLFLLKPHTFQNTIMTEKKSISDKNSDIGIIKFRSIFVNSTGYQLSGQAMRSC